MSKFRSINQVARRAGIALVLAVTLSIAMLPTVAMAAPLSGQHGQHGPHGPGCPNYYIVKKGDTLSGIAVNYHVSLWDLRDVNHIGNINRIYTGEYICIPASRNHGGYPGGHQDNHQGGHQGGLQVWH